MMLVSDTDKDLEFYEDESLADPAIVAAMEQEIENVPRNSDELREELREHNAASPADSGGDIDAEWQEVETTGSETVFGHNPTPDQSNAEANANAMGIDFQDNEPLDFVDKLEKRDRDRFELELLVEAVPGGLGRDAVADTADLSLRQAPSQLVQRRQQRGVVAEVAGSEQAEQDDPGGPSVLPECGIRRPGRPLVHRGCLSGLCDHAQAEWR